MISYVLQKGWIDKEEESQVVPTYEEIVNVEEDAEGLERAEQFERAHNFRFQEPDGTHLQTFPRDIDTTLRRKEDKRKEDRKRRAERQAEEKLQKIEQLKRLKNLKKKQILEKLEKVQITSGCSLEKLRHHLQLNKEFDSEEFNDQMHYIFDETYYESNEEISLKKPRFEHDPLIDNENDDHCEEDHEEKERTKHFSSKISKRQSIHTSEKMISDQIHHQVPSLDKTKEKLNSLDRTTRQNLERDLEDYHNIGYEDILGDMPTRFKYRQVKPAKYGLTVEEILLSDDKDLNARISLKKMAPYRETNRKLSSQQSISSSHSTLKTDKTISNGKLSESRLQSYQTHKKHHSNRT